jgi:integrase
MARPGKPWFRAEKNTWYATVNGWKTSLGVRGRASRKEAYDAWHKLLANGEPVAGVPGLRRNAGEVIRRFFDDVGGRVKPKTLRWYRDFLEPFARRHGRLAVADITPTLAESYSRKAAWSASTRHGFLGALMAAFRWAVRARMIGSNPLDGLRRPPKVSRGATCLITPKEHETIVAAASPRFRLFLTVLHATGARPSEVAAISAENFDAEAGAVRLIEHKTAHLIGKPRIIYLTPQVTELLKRQSERFPVGPLLRNRDGNPWNGRAVVEAMRRLRKRTGILHAVAYGYRHSWASDALEHGVPDALVAELLGHRGTAMLHKHYSHLGAKARALREALNRVR